MFCPGCALPVNDDTKFCKSCGAHLRGVREAMTGRGEPFDWSRTWVAEIFMTEEERERRRGVTPEQKRINEIRAGVITTLTGVGVMIFLYFFMGAIANNNQNPGEADILRHIWLAGIIPFLIGIGLLINGIFLSHHAAKLPAPPISLPQPKHTTNQLNAAQPSPISITEHTTAHLPEQREAAYVLRHEEER